MTLRIQLVLWCVFLLHSLKSESMQINQLDSSWEFRKSTETTWHRAQVPGSIHTDLFQNKLIPDPFFGTNEQQLQWIDTCDWVYRNIFTCSSQLLGSDEVELIFEGLDTYAEVTLNGERILSADNMFRRWTIPCKKILHVGKNTLQIYFTSAVKKGKGLAAKMPYTLPAEERVITRKAAYQYGWDWGPRFVSCGIWKPVSLLAYNRFHLTDFFIRQESLTDSFAELNAFLTVQGVDSGALSVRIFNRTQGTQELVPVYYRPGINKFKIHLTLANPVKWWCRGETMT